MAASRPLHRAIAWTVPMWFWTARRLGMTSSAWSGSSTVKRGRIEEKYGAFWPKTRLKTRVPTLLPTTGRLLAVRHMERTWLMPGMLPVGNPGRHGSQDSDRKCFS